MTTITELKNYLLNADKILFSYQCPYLAFAKSINFIDDDFVKNNPSNFSRMSMSKMIRFLGIDDMDISNYIYRQIEKGKTLKEISESF